MSTLHRAKYILAEPNLLLENAAVHLTKEGRISKIEKRYSPPADKETEIIDWGSAVIMPGLINAHTHLELTHLIKKITKFNSFTDWISQLVKKRRTWTKEDYIASADEGIRLSIESGTTLVGDIASNDFSWYAAEKTKIRIILFEELVAFSPEDADKALNQLKLRIERNGNNKLLLHGISPHAPYSVSPVLYRRMAQFAGKRKMLIATHVAETIAEQQFIKKGTGEFYDFLNSIAVIPKEWKHPGMSPIKYVVSLGMTGDSSILIHCNYLDDEDIDKIYKTHSHVVYCPRSHDYFGHKRHPIRKLLDSGINVALGTDSLASNETLSILDEMRFININRKDINAEEIFRAATVNGAAALSFQKNLGLLRKGYIADMTVLKLPELKIKDLLQNILEGAGECIGTIVNGRILWRYTE